MAGSRSAGASISTGLLFVARVRFTRGRLLKSPPVNLITASYAFGLFAYYYVPDDANTPPFEVVNY